MIHHLVLISFAYILDLIIGDPRWLPHPVRLMGKLISLLERLLNRGTDCARKGKGIVFLLLILLIVGAVTIMIVRLSYAVHPIFGSVVEVVLIATTIATKGLRDAALGVYRPLKNGELEAARYKLSWIVGRDTEHLPESEIVRGTVETVAENTSDAIIAPLFWALIGGAPLALLYRAVNTCDSMVGYKNERYVHFGWAAARFDDLLNILPSRISGYVAIVVNRPLEGQSRRACWQLLKRDARKHPSPNSGFGEAATAALLGVQLGGINRYKGVISHPAHMGDPLVPLQQEHIPAAIRIMEVTVISFIVLLWIGGIVVEISRAWS